MADTKISALGAIPAVDGADELPIVDATDTVTKKVTITQLDGRYATAAQGTTAGASAYLPLNVQAYDYAPGVGHPDVLRVPGGWNGYEYWMAFTPLPGTLRENPSIVASHDGITWEVPAGLTNPIFTNAEALAFSPAYDYWADTDLVLSHDGLTLMMYFKGTKTGIRNEYLLSTSTDGVTWSAASVVINHAAGAAVSPSVIAESGGTFTLFEIKDSTIARRTSADGSTWTAATLGTIPTVPAPYNLWHIGVCKVDATYHALVQYTTANSRTDPFRLAYWTSSDGLAWTGDAGPAVPLSGRDIDAMGHYRSTFLPAASGQAGRFDLWVNTIDNNGTTNHTAAVWRIALYRNYDFANGDAWTFQDARPPDINRDEAVIVPARQMQLHTGTPTASFMLDTPTWVMKTDDYVSVVVPPMPDHWNLMAVDLLIANSTTNNGDVVFEPFMGFAAPGLPIAAGVTGGTRLVTMPGTQYDMVWMTLYDGTLSAFDLRKGAFTTLKIRRRGGPSNTYGTVDLLHIVAVRFRRISDT